MARRPYIDEPMSRTALWSSRLAWFGVAVAALSVLILRADLLEAGAALTTFAAGLAFAAFAILLALCAFVVIWRQGMTGLGRAVLGLFLGLALLAYPAYLAYRALMLPPIYDITTDPVNPPRFDVLAGQRPKNRVAYPGAAAAALQRKAYPDIVPLQLALPVPTAYRIALDVIIKRKWPIAEAIAPTAGRRDAAIETTVRSLMMGFRDDIVIRVSPLGSGPRAGSRIDLRSASRYGTHDLGANAERLRALLEDIDDAAGNTPEPRPEPEPVKKPAPRRPAKR